MRVRVRLGAGLSRFADAPLLSVDLAEGASVEDLLAAVAEPSSPRSRPPCAPRCRWSAARTSSASSRCSAGDEVALLIPVAGGV